MSAKPLQTHHPIQGGPTLPPPPWSVQGRLSTIYVARCATCSKLLSCNTVVPADVPLYLLCWTCSGLRAW